ncbi:MAG: hypothetical protein DRI73_11295 [Bacteroidetes bacterium]|nr:MAG: hypothetical protein DRI73_11295 [Bacteroidota bacterium]
MAESSENNIKNYREELYIQTDRDLYIIGEQVWLKVFKLDALNNKPNNLSKVVYIELINSAGFPVKQIKISSRKKSESVSFNLSDTLSSGNYLLRAYTNWMKNYNQKDFAFKNISIINPFNPPGGIKIQKEEPVIDLLHYYPEGERIILSIEPDKTKYGSREKVRVEVKATDRKGKPIETDLSVSVTKSFLINETRTNIDNRHKHLSSLKTGISSDTLIGINDKPLSFTSSNPDFMNQPNFTKTGHHYLPELEGNIISGTLISSTTEKPEKNKDVVFSLVGQVAKCQFYKTNDSGDFHFVMNETGVQEIVIQTLKAGSGDYFIELEPDFTNSSNHALPGPFYLDTSKLEKLNKSIISMQVENIYQAYRQDDQNLALVNDSINFYGDPENSVEISDFINLTTVREVIKEIVPHVTARKKDGKILFHITNDIIGQHFENDPFVIVDGIPFNDVEQILNMRSADLERIDVLNLKYFIDGQIFDGIISFVTKKGNLEILDFDYSIFRQAYTGYNKKVKFNSPNYRIDSLKNSRIPDFRNTLYWNPDLHMQKDGTLSFEFFTSDEPGSYTILIEGISPDGDTGAIRKEFIIN